MPAPGSGELARLFTTSLGGTVEFDPPGWLVVLTSLLFYGLPIVAIYLSIVVFRRAPEGRKGVYAALTLVLGLAAMYVAAFILIAILTFAYG